MVRMKKWRLVFVASLLILAMAIPSYAALYTTPTEKAEALNRIGILKGTDGNYRLNEQISRSEATAFIVRLLGKEEYILANTAQFSKTNFSDVPATAWFAPYVGYLTNLGYLSGGTDGKFSPNSYITEKAFIKLILCSLNYTPDLDFNWDGIYRKAVEIGLITDLYYIARTDDNVNYTRGEAINLLYNALSLPTKGSDLPLFRQLIQSGEMSKDDALIAGLIYDTIRTEILEAAPTDMNMVTVTFNEEITAFENVYMYRSAYPEDKQECAIISMTANQIVIQTIPQIPLRDYTVEVTNAKDAEGNTIEQLKKSFYGFVAEKVNSTFFRISTIQPETSKSLNVIFTHPVNKNTEAGLYYSIFENDRLFADGQSGEITVRKLGSNPNGVLVTLANKSFDPNSTYTLKIGGRVLSAYGAQMNNGAGDEMKFIPGEGELEPFRLVDITTSDSETIRVEFNKEINPFIAQQIFNFYVTDENGKPIQVKKTAVEQTGSGQGKVLYININGTFTKEKNYNLTINNLNDATRQESITEQTYSFAAYYNVNEELALIGYTFYSDQIMELLFNKPLDPVSATNVTNFSVKEKQTGLSFNPVKIYHEAMNPEKIKLFFNTSNVLNNQKIYEMRISTLLKDIMGKNISKSVAFDFIPDSAIGRLPLDYSDVSLVASDSIKLTFNKEFALDANIVKPDNYILEYSIQGVKVEKNPVSLIYIDNKTLILKFDELAYDTDYTLKIVSIKDFSETERNTPQAIRLNFESEVYEKH